MVAVLATMGWNTYLEFIQTFVERALARNYIRRIGDAIRYEWKAVILHEIKGVISIPITDYCTFNTT